VSNPYSSPQGFGQPPQGFGPPPQEATSGLAIAALVVGILGFFAACCPLIGLPVNITAIILGFMSINKPGRGMAIAGLILGGIGLLLTLANAILGAYLAASGQHPMFQQ
jgi:hypothetical protein